METLQENKLIGCADYVLQRDKIWNESTESSINSAFLKLGVIYTKIVKYSNFLKQPITLGMFVPCSLDGVVLIEPKEEMFEVSANEKCSGWKYLVNENGITRYYDAVSFEKAKLEFQEALSRVIFDKVEFNKLGDTWEIVVDSLCVGRYYSIDNIVEMYFETIEDITPYPLTLTPNVFKLFNL